MPLETERALMVRLVGQQSSTNLHQWEMTNVSQMLKKKKKLETQMCVATRCSSKQSIPNPLAPITLLLTHHSKVKYNTHVVIHILIQHDLSFLKTSLFLMSVCTSMSTYPLKTHKMLLITSDLASWTSCLRVFFRNISHQVSVVSTSMVTVQIGTAIMQHGFSWYKFHGANWDSRCSPTHTNAFNDSL